MRATPPSLAEAQAFFEEKVLPRRTRDIAAEQKHISEFDSPKCFYRRVGLEEPDRGELYPIWSAGMDTFAHFGIGIGIYFSQLLFLMVVCLVGGLLMILAASAYRAAEYNADDPNKSAYPLTASCNSYINVTATAGCENGQAECLAKYTYNCDFPYLAGVADLAMSAFFATAVFASALIEHKIVENLDEAVQTASDYSVEVKDPPADSDNPDEWQNYFSRFGVVRYVSIMRRNKELLEVVTGTHRCAQRLIALERLPPERANPRRVELYRQQFQLLSEKLALLCRRSYPVCRVYVTFEHEDHQRLCLGETEVPDMYAIFDIATGKAGRTAFRKTEILNISEPPEPDNVVWENLESSAMQRNSLRALGSLVVIALLVCTWYLVQFTRSVSPGLLAFVIGLVDSLLPAVFEALTDLGLPLSQGGKQAFLQLRLFAARLLLSTVLPYIQTEWNRVLDPAFIRQVVVVQLAACFTAPALSLLDLGGAMRRYLSRSAASQEEMNLKWAGSEWSLAEKYTGIAKVLFVSLYYALLLPYSLFLCVPAFALIFCADRYLLLRRWRRMPMLDAKVAERLRQQAILAVAAHMYVSMRFIYSWPMDEAWQHRDGVFEKVDKYPVFGVWDLNLQAWQSSGQKRIFYSYKICLFVTAATALIVWVVVPLLKLARRFFCSVVQTVGQSQGFAFSSLRNVSVYEPLVQTAERSYRCAYTVDVHPEHRPSVLVPGPSDPLDLDYHIPEQQRPFVLSVVKYYRTDRAVPLPPLGQALLGAPGTVSPYDGTLLDKDSDEEDHMLGTDAGRVRPPAPPPIPSALSDMIKGKAVARGAGADGTAASGDLPPPGAQRLRALQLRVSEEVTAEHRKAALRVSRDSRGTGRVMPAGTVPGKPTRLNRRYERAASFADDDDMA